MIEKVFENTGSSKEMSLYFDVKVVVKSGGDVHNCKMDS